jgi:glyoxylase-like metal-dependent hydrolase (beta-lactamase superfamily II)
LKQQQDRAALRPIHELPAAGLEGREESMEHYICLACGTQFAESEDEPDACPICTDERQYVRAGGQAWTTLSTLRLDHRTVVREIEPDLFGIGMEPSFAIGQRALLVRTPEGNVLWDCISLIDDATVQAVKALGGIAAIAVSHPHYYSSMVEWAHAFDAPIYLHEEERQWVMRPDNAVQFWSEERHLLPGGLTLIRTGGHYSGALVLHWPAGAGGRGALLSGDIIMVLPDRRFVSFMYSYPNLIPLPASTVRDIAAAVEPFAFDRIYGAWWERVSTTGGAEIVRRSAARYIAALEGRFPPT